jgi:hypothetical protein
MLRIVEYPPRQEPAVLKPSASRAPIWIAMSRLNSSGEIYVTIECPECLKVFPKVLNDTINPISATSCLYCRRLIRYATVPQDKQARSDVPSSTPVQGSVKLQSTRKTKRVE